MCKLDETNIISGVYFIKCLINNIVYVGKSLNIHKRINEHEADYRKFVLDGTKKETDPIELLNDWKQYGKKNFSWGILIESNPDDLNSQKDVFNRYMELKYIYEIYPAQGIETYNTKSDHDRLLLHNMKFIKDVMSQYGDRIIGVQSYLGGKSSEKNKLDILYIDGIDEKIKCIDIHDPTEEPRDNKSINTFLKHKQYCEQKGIKFWNVDPRILDPWFTPEPQSHYFEVVIDDFNVKQ